MPRSSLREIARDFAYMTVARGASIGVGVLRSLVIPGLLGPLAYGVWKTLDLIQNYAKFIDLGARAALRREIPYAVGKDDTARLALVRDVAFGVNNAAILIAGAVTVAIALGVDEPAMRSALFVFLPLLFVEHVYAYLEHLLYGHKEFPTMAKINIVVRVAGAAAAIPLTWAFGLTGLIVGSALTYLGGTLLQLRLIGFAIRPRWSWTVYRELVTVGFPAHLNGFLYNILLSIGRLFVLSFLGLTGMGFYALGTTINQYIFQLSYTFGNVLSPHLVERYTERERIEDLREMVVAPLLIISKATPLILGLVFFGAKGAILTVLPEFEPGILPMQILLVGTWFSSVPRGLSSFFITIRKQGQTIPVYLAAILVNAGTVGWLMSSGHGMVGAAVGTVVALALLGTTLVVLALRYFMAPMGIALFLLRLAWPPALAVGLVAVAQRASESLAAGQHVLVQIGVAALVFLAGYSPVVISLWRGYRHRLGG